MAAPGEETAEREAATGAALILVREGRPGALHAAAEVWTARGCPTLAALMESAIPSHLQSLAAGSAPGRGGSPTAARIAASPATASTATAALRARARQWFAQARIAGDETRVPASPSLAAPPR